jgi:hypothetical protein
MGKSSDDILRHLGNSHDAVVPLEYRRHHGAVVPVPVLASMLLRMHQEAKEGALKAGPKYEGQQSTAGVSRCGRCALWEK